ncbi:MBL fold metallo-hydrolase [Thermococcus stetteri]|uniref:MBL fold metallo-hydrolase n=1 Tax=Thermococcus stetteri TaxID=49900 RepID=UPI001AE3DCA6|nr:MBL fold metallo-hydrolase [Thermococcus stetteri]MBP1911716.1 putative metallo-beta-lactamase superfamily hydrolase [Thermococcus stetteri]
MRVIPLASESLGVRSLATFMEASGVKILIDPGVALGPKRYGLPPAEIELRALQQMRRKLQGYARKAEVVTISHYHYDHHTPFFEGLYESSSEAFAREIYSGKLLFIKHPTENINFSQRKRAWAFLKNAEPIAKKIEYADGKSFDLGGVALEFSPAVPHGSEGSKLGFVVMVLIDDGSRRIIHASDIQLLNRKAVEWIVEKNPDLLITGGPPTYLGPRAAGSWETGIKNLNEIIRETGAEIILDHHIVRDKRYPEFFSELEKTPKTFARYIGVEDRPLEAYRRELHKIEKGEAAEVPFGLG